MDRSFVKGVRRFVPRFLQTRSKPRAGFAQPLQFEPLEARELLTTITAGGPCLLVGSTMSATILAYSATSQNTYVQSYAPTSGAGGYVAGFVLGVGATQGKMFVATGSTGEVQEFNASTGAYVATIVASNSGLGGNRAITIGPDGNLYVVYSSSIRTFSPTGAQLGTFVSGLFDPEGVIFGPNGNLYVANNTQASSNVQGEILEYQGPNSTSPGTLFASLKKFDMVSFTDSEQQLSGGMAFGPSGSDLAGCLFVSCYSSSKGWVEQIIDTVANGVNTFNDFGAYIAPSGAYGNSKLKMPAGLAFGTTPGSPGGPAHITTLWVADSNSNCVGWYTDEPADGGSTYGWYQGKWVSQNTAGKDSLYGPNTIAFASLASLPTGADLAVSSPGGVFGGTTTVTATMTYNGVPIPNETISFTLNPGLGLSSITGTATTDANGVATLNNFGPLSPYSGQTAAKLMVDFAGDPYYAKTSYNVGVLVEAVTPTVTIIAPGGTFYHQCYPATGTVTGVNGADLGTPTFTYYQGTYTTVAELNGVTPFGAVPWWTGSWTVLASYPPPPAAATGYTGASVVANFAITPCPLTLTATGQNKPYDGTTAATVTLSASNVQPLDSILLNYATANFANQNANTGITVDVSGITIGGADAWEYTLSPTTASTMANITPIPLTITANNQTMTTGNMLPPLTAAYTGLVNGDTPSSLTSPPVLSTTATPQSGVGSYPITIGCAASPNYTITQDPGVMTVVAQSGPAQLLLDNKGKVQFHNANGDLVQVELTGGGTGTIYLAHGGNCDPDHIVLTGTTDQSVLTITAPARGKAFTLRGIDVEGPIKAITATSVNFTGSLTVKPSGRAKAKVNLKFCQISDAAILSGMPVGSLKTMQWLDTTTPTDLLEAPSVDSIVISGRHATRTLPQVAGDFQADVHLTGGLAKITLGSVKVAGDLSAEHWEITGSVGTFTVNGAASHRQGADTLTIRSTAGMGAISLGAVDHVDFLAGVRPPDNGELIRHAAGVSDFRSPLAGIQSVTITGTAFDGPTPPHFFMDSNFSAPAIGAVRLLNVDLGNPGDDPFGLYGQTIRSVNWKDTADRHSKIRNGSWRPRDGSLPARAGFNLEIMLLANSGDTIHNYGFLSSVTLLQDQGNNMVSPKSLDMPFYP